MKRISDNDNDDDDDDSFAFIRSKRIGNVG